MLTTTLKFLGVALFGLFLQSITSTGSGLPDSTAPPRLFIRMASGDSSFGAASSSSYESPFYSPRTLSSFSEREEGNLQFICDKLFSENPKQSDRLKPFETLRCLERLLKIMDLGQGDEKPPNGGQEPSEFAKSLIEMIDLGQPIAEPASYCTHPDSLNKLHRFDIHLGTNQNYINICSYLIHYKNRKFLTCREFLQEQFLDKLETFKESNGRAYEALKSFELEIRQISTCNKSHWTDLWKEVPQQLVALACVQYLTKWNSFLSERGDDPDAEDGPLMFHEPMQPVDEASFGIKFRAKFGQLCSPMKEDLYPQILDWARFAAMDVMTPYPFAVSTTWLALYNVCRTIEISNELIERAYEAYAKPAKPSCPLSSLLSCFLQSVCSLGSSGRRKSTVE